MENFEDMKTMWVELNNRLTSLEEENRKLANKVMNSKMMNAQDKLIRKYNAFIFIELIMVLWMPLFLLHNPLVIEKYKIITMIYWSLFFLGEVSVDLYLRNGIKSIDIHRSAVSEIAAKALHNWKIHKIAIIVGLPIAIGACILFGLTLGANEFTVMGMIVGGMIGLAIAIVQLSKFSKYYHTLQSPLSE